jgi:hypothetical protein
MKSFYLAGIKYQSTPERMKLIHDSDILLVIQELDNQTDPNALAVYFKGYKMGYVPKSEAIYLRMEVDIYGSAHLKIIQHFPERPSWKRFKVIPLPRRVA